MNRLNIFAAPWQADAVNHDEFNLFSGRSLAEVRRRHALRFAQPMVIIERACRHGLGRFALSQGSHCIGDALAAFEDVSAR